jgi:hypothetical protein
VTAPDGGELSGHAIQDALKAVDAAVIRLRARIEQRLPTWLPRTAESLYDAAVTFNGRPIWRVQADRHVLAKVALDLGARAHRTISQASALVFSGRPFVGKYTGGRYEMVVPNASPQTAAILGAAIEDARQRELRHIERLAGILDKVGINLGEAQKLDTYIQLGFRADDVAQQYGLQPDTPYEVVGHNFQTDLARLQPKDGGPEIEVPGAVVEEQFEAWHAPKQTIERPGERPPTPIERSEEEWEAIRQRWRDVTLDEGPGSVVEFDDEEPEAPQAPPAAPPSTPQYVPLGLTEEPAWAQETVTRGPSVAPVTPEVKQPVTYAPTVEPEVTRVMRTV